MHWCQCNVKRAVDNRPACKLTLEKFCKFGSSYTPAFLIYL